MINRLLDKIPSGTHVTARVLIAALLALLVLLIASPVASALWVSVRIVFIVLGVYEIYALIDRAARNTLSELYVLLSALYPIVPFGVGCAFGGWCSYLAVMSMHNLRPITFDDLAAVAVFGVLMGHLNWQFARGGE